MGRTPLLLLALPCLASSMVGEGPRHALIIANDYTNDPSLALDGAEALAQEFASTLEQMMWHVKTYRAASRSKMHDAIRRFSNTISEVHDGVALFIFIGRGVHLNGRNLMVPAKLPVHEPKSYMEDVEHEAVAVEKVLRRMQAADTTNFVILDAGMGAKSSVLFPGLTIGGMRPSGSAAALNMRNTLVVYGGVDGTGNLMQADAAEMSDRRSRLPGLPRGPLLSACLLRRMVAGLSLKQQQRWLNGKMQSFSKGNKINVNNKGFGADLGSVQRLLTLDALLRRVRADVVAASALTQHIATFSTMVHDVLLNPGAVDAVLQANLLAHGASASTGDSEVHGEVEIQPDGSVGAQDGDLAKLSFLELARGIAVALAGNGAGGSAAVESIASGAGGDSSDLQHALLDVSAFAALRRDRLRQLRKIAARHNAAQEREAVLAQERAVAAARLEQQRRDASVRDETARRAASPSGFEYTYEFPGQDLRLRFVSTEAEGRENNARVVWHATASELVKATGAGWSTVKYPPVAEGDIVVAVNGERTAGWNLKRVSAALDAATKAPGRFNVSFRTVRSESDYRRDAALARVGQWEWKRNAHASSNTRSKGAQKKHTDSERPTTTKSAAPPTRQPTLAPTPQITAAQDDSAELLEAARAAVARVRKEEQVKGNRREAARKIQQLRARFNKDQLTVPIESDATSGSQAPAQVTNEDSAGTIRSADASEGRVVEKKNKAKARALKAQEQANAKKAAQAEESVKAEAKAAAATEKQAKSEAETKAAEKAKAESSAKAKAAQRAKVEAEEKAAEAKMQEAKVKEKERQARIKAKAETEKSGKEKTQKKIEHRLKRKEKHKESQRKESAVKVEKQQKNEAQLAKQRAAVQSVTAEEAVANAVKTAAEKGVKKQLSEAGFAEPERRRQQQQSRAAGPNRGSDVKEAGVGGRRGDMDSSESSPADRVKAAVEKATKAAMKNQLKSGGF